jgi:hypothetical protein
LTEEQKKLERFTKFKQAFSNMVGTTEDAYKKINGKYSTKTTRHYTPEEI